MSPIKLFLFGTPRLERDGEPVDISLRKALALLAYLAATKQSHSRDALSTLFWPDDDQRKARGNLRRALSRINAALGKGRLETARERAGLGPKADLWLDIDHFQRHLAACQTHGHPPNEVCVDCLPHSPKPYQAIPTTFWPASPCRTAPTLMNGSSFKAKACARRWPRLLSDWCKVSASKATMNSPSPTPDVG